MLTHSFKHMNMLTCIYSHNHLHTNMNVFTYTPHEPVYKLTCALISTFMHVDMVKICTEMLSHINTLMHLPTEMYAHINKLTQMNMVTHSLADEHANIMHILTNSLVHEHT